MIVHVCGKGEIACNALRYVSHFPGVELVCTPTRDDRGYDTWYPSLKRQARALGVSIVPLGHSKGDADAILLSLEYDRIIRVDRFASSQLFNLHFSLLPKYRGVHTSMWPILNGEAESGVTLHVMDAGVDTGPIIAQAAFPLPADCTARDLYARYMREAFALFRQALPTLLSGEWTATPQVDAEASAYSRSSIDFATARELNLTQPADVVARQARAFTFPEYQLPTLEGRPVLSCHPILGGPAAERDEPWAAIRLAGDGAPLEIVWA